MRRKQARERGNTNPLYGKFDEMAAAALRPTERWSPKMNRKQRKAAKRAARKNAKKHNAENNGGLYASGESSV